MDKRKISQKNIFIFYILSTILIILFCLYSLYLRDFSKKYSALVYDISNFSKYYENNNFNCSTSAENYISPNNACILGNEQKTELALIGDSHLDIISKELKKELTLLGVSAYQFSYGGCVPSLNLKVYNDKRYICNKYFTEVLNKLKNEPNIKKIVLFSRWSFNLKGERFNNKEGGIEIGSGHYFIPINSDVLVEKKIRQEEILKNIEIFIKKIKNLDKDIYIVMPTPEMGWEVPNNLARILHYKNKIEKNTLSISKKVFDERNSEIYKFFSNLKQKYNLNLIYPNDIFCEDLKCFSHKNNIPLFFDDDHLSIEGAKLLSKKIINHIYSN